MRELTAGELQNTMPVGVDTGGGARERGFGFKPWRGRDERIIGAMRDKNRSMPPGQFTTRVLAHFLTHWGGKSFDGLDDREKWHTLASSYMADVLYAWCALRRAALGDTFAAELACPVCRHRFEFDGDLSALPVLAADDDDNLRIPHQLKGSFEYLGKEASTLVLAPSRWVIYEALGKEGLNIGAIKLRTIAASVVAVDGVDARLAAEQLDDLTKLDLEELYTAIADNQPGPDLRIKTVCPACGMQIDRSFSWGYEAFFSATSSSSGES